MARTITPVGPAPEPADDHYIIEREDEAAAPPIGARLISVARGVLVVILAFVSLALFWLLGNMFGLL